MDYLNTSIPRPGQIPASWIVWNDGANWRGDSLKGKASATPGTDAPTVINAVLAVATPSDVIVVLGDFSSANTISFTTAIGGYYHYGQHTVTGGTSVGILINDPAPAGTALPAFTSPDYSNTGQEIYIRRLLGPAGISGSTFGASSAGVRLQNCMQKTLRFGMIQGFQYGFLVDQTVVDSATALAICNDNQFHCRTLRNNNYAVRFLGPPAVAGSATVQCQGNEWFLQVIYPLNGAFGVVKDANLIHQLQQWYHLSMVPSGGASGFWIANPGNSSNRPLSADFILALFWVDNVNNVLQVDDVLISHNSGVSGASSSNAFGGLTKLAKLGLSQKELAKSFTTATSLAVTFPMIEFDTNYSVIPSFSLNVGNWWITAKTTTGCTINWVTSSTGSLDYMVYR